MEKNVWYTYPHILRVQNALFIVLIGFLTVFTPFFLLVVIFTSIFDWSRGCQSTASALWMHKAAVVIGEGLIMCIDQDSAYSLTSGKKVLQTPNPQHTEDHLGASSP